MYKKLDITTQVLQIAQEKNTFKMADLLQNIKASRQYLNLVLNKLILEKKLIKSGSLWKTRYALPGKVDFFGMRIKKTFVNKKLAEHEVLQELREQAPFIYPRSDNAGSIFDYAFSEMLNNAIEHSKSNKIEIEVNTLDDNIIFKIRDFGIGVFRNVKNKFKLKSDPDAAIELLKGKVTTAPKFHSGEGIFFTSKIADIFTLESFDLKLKIDNLISDVFLEEIKPEKKGTEVIFQINKKTAKHLSTIFEAYQTDPSEYAFDKTEIKVKLYTLGTIYISRSQARRLLFGLEKFKKVVLDFDHVETVGQAFVDEIFRVFKNSNSKIEISPINMNKTVEFMVGRVSKS